MLPVSELPLLVEERVCGVEIMYLPCLASGNNSNLNYEDMDDLRRQGIYVDKNNNPVPVNIPVPRNIPLTQIEEDNSWRSEVIIFPGGSKILHNTNAAFKNYTREEVIKMTKLEFLNFITC